MKAGYSHRSLLQKLGIKAGHRVVVVGAPDDYWRLLGPLPRDVVVFKTLSAKRLDVVHIFAREIGVLDRTIKTAARKIVSDGMIWASWPKRGSQLPTSLSGDSVRKVALSNGLVDIKVCAIDETWSGLKLVIPVKDRAAGGSSRS